MKKQDYLVVAENVLPEVFRKVRHAARLLESGEAASTTQAARMAGVSRSVYYKYKDAVFAYEKPETSRILTVQVTLTDRPGVLVSLLTVFYRAGANILTVNQGIPLRGRAYVSVTAQIGRAELSAEDLVESLRLVDGVVKLDSITD